MAGRRADPSVGRWVVLLVDSLAAQLVDLKDYLWAAQLAGSVQM